MTRMRILARLVALSLSVLPSCRKTDAAEHAEIPPIPLEQQLKRLVECGILTNPAVSVENVLREQDPEASESVPYQRLLVVLGGEDETQPGERLSPNLWHFDTECIEGPGAYRAIAERLRDLAGGAFPLDAVGDFVDRDTREAWVAFRLDGNEHRFQAQVDDDWVDPTMLSRFARLLAHRNVGKRFTYLALDGQDCLIGCSTPEEREALRALTGLDVIWLE